MCLEAVMEITCLIFPLYSSGLLWGADNGERERKKEREREWQEAVMDS